MIHKRRNGFLAQVGDAQEHYVITKRFGCFRLRNCLARFPANAGNSDHVVFAHFFDRQFKDWLEQSDLWITDGELRGVHTHGDPASTGSQVVARQGTLALFVQFALASQGKGMCRNYQAAAKPVSHRHQNFPSRD